MSESQWSMENPMVHPLGHWPSILAHLSISNDCLTGRSNTLSFTNGSTIDSPNDDDPMFMWWFMPLTVKCERSRTRHSTNYCHQSIANEKTILFIYSLVSVDLYLSIADYLVFPINNNTHTHTQTPSDALNIAKRESVTTGWCLFLVVCQLVQFSLKPLPIYRYDGHA